MVSKAMKKVTNPEERTNFAFTSSEPKLKTNIAHRCQRRTDSNSWHFVSHVLFIRLNDSKKESDFAVNPPTGFFPYAVFLLRSTTLWLFFMSSPPFNSSCSKDDPEIHGWNVGDIISFMFPLNSCEEFHKICISYLFCYGFKTCVHEITMFSKLK